MQEEKKQLEILIMDYFRKSYPDFPKGSLAPSESPDFLLKMKSKNSLGIELTRLNPGNAELPGRERLNDIRLREDLIAFAQELFEKSSELKLFIKILFSEHKKISPERSMSISVRLNRLIQNAVQNKNEKSFFKETISKNALPEGIEEVLILHHPKLKTAFWERSNNLGISNNVVDDVHKAILKKDEKLSLYRKNHLNYYWLVITTDRLRGVKAYNLSNKIMNQNFESSFQHVFLFDLLKSKVYLLV